jgi:hypothetical protein
MLTASPGLLARIEELPQENTRFGARIAALEKGG